MNRNGQKAKFIVFFLTLVLGILVSSGCRGGPKAGERGPVGFDKTNRVITFGDGMPMSQWNDPSVLREGDEYIMYLSSNIERNWKNVLPFRAVSPDGIDWEIDPRPLLTVGRKGSFDEKKVETPSVVYFKGKYHMYYTGVSDKGLRGPLAIGHAVSSDGINWRRVSDEPVLEPTGNPGRDWNGFHVAEPGAVVFDDKLYLFFHASGARPNGVKPANKSVIGLAISDDGHNFSKPGQVLTQGEQYAVTAEERYVGYSTPSALVISGKLHLFYDVIATKSGWEQVALHHAISSDGKTWTEDPEPFLQRHTFPWTKTEVRAPTALYEDGVMRVWFAGHDRQNLLSSGIGLVEISIQ